MIQELRVRHVEHVTTQSFEKVVATFGYAVGSIEKVGWPALPGGARDEGEFRSRVEKHLGPSGFTRFRMLDHGDWLKLYGQKAKVMMDTLGNPLIAITMLRHDIRADLNVPVRLFIYRDEASGTTRLAYDVPSRLMGNIADEACLAAARGLDAKLAALAEQATGTTA
jgi:uncharacterized protein (DUF302 family)